MSTVRQPGTVLTDHRFDVPVDHDRPDGPRLRMYAREVVATDQVGKGLPWLLFLQGGPGFGAPRPVGRDGWLDRVLRDYRVLLLDQRGTGLSTPVTPRTLAAVGDARAQADYLACFRADSIVRDAELIRRTLLGDEPWSVLGQSFGGFCAITYLSFAPEGLREVLVTGGLPGLTATAADVYRTTYPKVIGKNAEHYARYPDDAAVARRVADELAERKVLLPSGRRLTVEAFQTVGQLLGTSTGSHELHYLLEYAYPDGTGLTDAFLFQVDEHCGLMASAPIYLLLHEPCYAQGSATGWAAQRVRAEFPEFDPSADPVLFTGEMTYPWMIDVDPTLEPLRELADRLSERDDWPALYDPDRLAANKVPIAAAVYHDDPYVPYELSMGTVRAIPGLRAWVTNEYEHDGLRQGSVLDRLIKMVRGEA